MAMVVGLLLVTGIRRSGTTRPGMGGSGFAPGDKK
jgi:hypothetical protein